MGCCGPRTAPTLSARHAALLVQRERNRRRWRVGTNTILAQVTAEVGAPLPSAMGDKRRGINKLTDETKARIAELVPECATVVELARRVGLGQSTIWRYAHRGHISLVALGTKV